MTTLKLIQVQNALLKIQEHIHYTPVMQSRIINEITDRTVHFKCENLQKTGSFKIRGAINNISSKCERGIVKGVIAYSSGNHGQAVAWAAKTLNLPSIIIVPEGTHKIKCDAIEAYGGRLVVWNNSLQSGFETRARLSIEYGYEIINDDHDSIAGQATVGLEFLAQVPQLDAVLISISGGGLSAGCALAMKSLKPNVKVYCVEPEGKELERSLRAGQRLWQGEPKFLNTIAEGIMTEQPGKIAFPILCEYAEKEVLTVNDDEMISGMKLSMKYLKQVVEASSGACIQALIKYNHRIPHTCRHIGVILCGGNTDVDAMLNYLYL